MMNYEYTEVNRLKEPHRYMYTSYQGAEFIHSYLEDRLGCVKILQSDDNQSSYNPIDLYLYSEAFSNLEDYLNTELSCQTFKPIKVSINLEDCLDKSNLSTFDIINDIKSGELLTALLFNQLNGKNKELIKSWLDLLVQRFEVTKKLYEVYPSGFRKGSGASNLVRIYWLFALSLALFYVSSKNIKYLNTLLKVSDLLCSLEGDLLKESIPSNGLLLILFVELISIKSLSKTIKEVEFEFD